MSHLIQTMAYRGETPWHGLGNKLTDHQSLDVWIREAGMDWDISSSPVNFHGEDYLRRFDDFKVLYRSDTQEPLSVVSKRYKEVQPREVMEFYRDLVEAGGFELETAGVLKGGRKLWALAKTGEETSLKGGDLVKGYLLLATACDGTMATTAQFTSIRVVCNNTLSIALDDRLGAIKVPHSTQFEAAKVKESLGVGLSAWQRFSNEMRSLAHRQISPFEAQRYLIEVLGDENLPMHDQPNIKIISQVNNLYDGAGRGANLSSAMNTAWGLLNSVTEYIDHERRARSSDNRLESAWFGLGASIKQKAFEKAINLTA